MKIQLFQFYVSYGNVEKNENKIKIGSKISWRKIQRLLFFLKCGITDMH